MTICERILALVDKAKGTGVELERLRKENADRKGEIAAAQVEIGRINTALSALEAEVASWEQQTA